MSAVKRIALLGASGSIGKQTVEIIERLPSEFELFSATVNSDAAFLEALCKKHKLKFAGIADEKAAGKFRFSQKNDLHVGEDCNSIAASLEEVDIVVIAISGLAALEPLLAAIGANKRIALANKEAMVCGGELVNAQMLSSTAKIIPVDSEQYAIFTCLHALKKEHVRRLILTASGGALRDYSKEQMKNAKLADVLRHPNWNMGRKITIDCATLANKGLEVIEAYYLFGIENIEVVMHPQSIIHSMVETTDSSVLAQLSIPDMRIPIQYALTYPDRLPGAAERLDFSKLRSLSFEAPDMERFPALKLAYEALKAKGSAPVVFDAANEEAVNLFINDEVSFMRISELIDIAFQKCKAADLRNTCDIIEYAAYVKSIVNQTAREYQ